MEIGLEHGEGGRATNDLIKEVFYKYFENDILLNSLDSAILKLKGNIAFTTDSFVVKPLFFNGGDIGKLAVNGTVNDLVVAGAKPLYLSCSFIIEEGFEIDILVKIVKSISEAAKLAGIKIVTGDTKVVAHNEADGIFINTAGIGIIEDNYCIKEVEENDVIIVTGDIAKHGTVILIERYNLDINKDIKSDCMSLSYILDNIKNYKNYIKIMKDPTRGGLGTILNEISDYYKYDIEVIEEKIPINREILAVNNILGIDPLYVACEGRMVIIVDYKKAQELLDIIKTIKGCENASIIGYFKKKNVDNKVYMTTKIGGMRILGTLDTMILPRIC